MTYAFAAQAAGILTVAVRGEGDTDFVLLVTDEDGQPLVDGRSDRDIGGRTGAEQVTVDVPGPGRYLATVVVNGGGNGKFNVGAAWLAMPQVAREPDPDGSPRRAVALELSKAKADSLGGPSGDLWDWYSVQCDAPGTLTVLTKSEGEGDIVLEVFAAGRYASAVDRSDQDMQGVRGNESVTANVQAGDTLYFRVSAHSVREPIAYKISSGFIPD
jgi:hypothetical protein